MSMSLSDIVGYIITAISAIFEDVSIVYPTAKLAKWLSVLSKTVFTLGLFTSGASLGDFFANRKIKSYINEKGDNEDNNFIIGLLYSVTLIKTISGKTTKKIIFDL